ncbi:uncharacterized protein LOC134183402 [Corticium candelabrum]|uniref:uncharacterized protein LOC134183402 n=1 Tax=Corticium candelabrum TaxID=121492 RepID=UPI002E257BFC|nr:uncharacterized protein LOC134183402 [Corticium candelabrum]
MAEFTVRISSEALQVHGIGNTRKKGGMKVQQSKKTGQQMARKPQGCHRCGGNHDSKEFRFKKAKCFACQKVRHVKSMCRDKSLETQYVEEEDSAEEVGISYLQSSTTDKGKQDKEESGGIHTIGQFTPKYTVQVQIAGQPMKMELDTRAVVSVISEEWYQRHLCQYPLKKTNMRLKDYQGNSLKVKGVVWAPVKYEKDNQTLPIVVVAVNRPALLGRN